MNNWQLGEDFKYFEYPISNLIHVILILKPHDQLDKNGTIITFSPP